MISPEYLAGFFDGEGTFIISQSIKKSTGVYYPKHTVMLSQSGEDGLALLTEIQKEDVGQIYQHLKFGDHKATKNAYKLYWRKQEAIALIPQLIPHLILKRKAAEEMMTYLTRSV